MSQTQSQKSFVPQGDQTEQDSFDPKAKKQTKRSKSKRTTQSASKTTKQQGQKKQKKKGGKKKQKQQKPQKEKKQPAAKRKPKSKKEAGKDTQQNKQKVLQYMNKQNRPYNLLNVFDNLHGKIKKPQLQIILNQLTDQGELSSKQFGKIKVYFLNQDKFDLNMAQVDQLSSTYTKLKEEQKELREQNKRLNDQYRKLMAKKTYQELQLQAFDLTAQISKLSKKKFQLTNGDIQKVDEQQVKKIQKQSEFLQKEIRKRKKLLKECLDSWSQMTEKKVPQIAQIMGIQLI